MLEVNSLEKTFGGVVALNNCTFTISDDEMVGLMGPNGAGKTTCFNCVSGLIKPDSGTVHLSGKSLESLSPAEISREGISRSFQVPRTLTDLTLEENLLLAVPDHPGESPILGALQTDRVLTAEEEYLDKAHEILRLVSLYDKRHDLASDLSVGQKKLLEISRCLMTDPEIMLLDEPLAGVDPTISDDIKNQLVEIHEEEDVPMLIIEHNVQELVKLVDRLLVMQNGSVLTKGDPESVVADKEVQESYLGGA
jgi:neutral amino acid transport system ATP-binding protein